METLKEAFDMGIEKKKQIIISVNSPGEIAGWMKPAVKAIKKRLPEFSIKALLLPCVFASGNEEQVLKDVPEIDGIIMKDGLKNMLLGKPSEDETDTYFLHIGGELALTAMLAERKRTFAWGYQWGTRRSDPHYAGYFVKSDMDRRVLLKRGIPDYKIHVTGDLLYDAAISGIEGGRPADPPENIKNITFMCGSRLRELKGLLPFFLKTAYILKKRHECLQFKTVISPFIDWNEFKEIGEIRPLKEVGGFVGAVEPDEMCFFLKDDPSFFIRLAKGNHCEEMNSSDFIVSIPGTKTGEAACLEKPMLVILPLNRPDWIPAFGIVGLLDWIPVIGPSLKGKLIYGAARKFGFTAQPNILAEREIVPEMKGILTPEGVAEKIDSLISDPERLSLMRKELADIYRPFRGASDRLADTFASSVKGLENKEKPYLSVVICTRNRKDLLKGTLLTLDDQSLPSSSYEIIVVDDGSEDGTEETVKSLKLKCSLTYIRKDWGGRSETRNVGIERAIGEICVFVDDDIMARHDFLENHASWHRRHPGSIVRGPIINVTEYKIPDYKPGPKDFSGALFCTCNASAPLGALKALGGFDAEFKEYGFEDNDMGWRLYMHGLKRRFNMDAVVFHYKPHKTVEALPAEIRNSQEMARSAVRFVNKHKHWKVMLSAKTDFFSIWSFKLFASYGFMNSMNMKSWKSAAESGDYKKMASLERKIKRYYYMTTLIDELGKNKGGEAVK